ncbi:MAG TPA: radical SAM protein [Blastocatellia bacterium]|nr:radical SAM protein [Blastocatellia bacterium]
MLAPSLSYGDFSLSLHRKLTGLRRGGQGIPSSGTIEVTRRCPLECAHCYNNLSMNDHEARRGEMTFEEHCRLLDEIAEAGCFWLLYTGGEIFARRDFLDIYTYARGKGLIVTLFTNGTLITEKIADYLVEHRPFNIEITLYGRTRETYERLTGIPGSYEKCLRGIRLLNERRLPLKIKTVAVTTNKHEILDMRRYVEEELGASFKFDAMMSPRIDCSQSPLAVRLKPEEIVELDIEDPARVAEWRRIATEFAPPPVPSAEVYHCGGGIDSFAVDPEGKMSICVLSHADTYDLRRGSFREGWEGFINKVRHKKATRLTKCSACALKSMCGMCPANGELENGDPESPVDFLCRTAHLRAHAFDIAVRPHGDCEYCEAGAGYDEMREAAAILRRRAQGEASVSARNRYLPVMAEQGSCGSGGCSSCH